MQSVRMIEAGLNVDRFSKATSTKASSGDLTGRLTHSRSTSAGSSRSGGQHSVDLQKPSPISYPTDALGLPEYDYPAPWSLEEVPQAAGGDYPSALIVKNTFYATPVLRPPSLDEFLEERATQSCPASAIGLPPGLEDLVDPEEAQARLNKLAAEAALRRKAESIESNFIPSGLFDEPLGMETHQHFFSAAQQPISIAPEWQHEHFQMQQQQQPQPVVLDLAQALADPFAAEPIQQHRFSDNQFACAAPPSYPVQAELQLGTPECPTEGSRGHFVGLCKPCAFLYTKGCQNGVNCPFCHLCDAGEKKRRQKENRAARRNITSHMKYALP